MISILIVSHGDLCKGIIDSMEMLLGKAEKVVPLPLCPSDSVDSYREKILCKIREIDDGDGVLVMVDMPGGSPYNAAASSLGKANFECVAGVNLSMLLTAVEERESCGLEELTELCIASSKDAIVNVKKFILGRQGE